MGCFAELAGFERLWTHKIEKVDSKFAEERLKAHIENTHPVADLKSPMFVDKGVFYCTTVELVNIVTQPTETEEHENTCNVIAAENIYDAKSCQIIIFY